MTAARGSPAKLSILLLEDSSLDAELVCAALEAGGIAHDADRVVDGPGFRAAAERGGYDIILADYVLPGFDGLEALAIARAACPETPFVFVSGTLGEDVAVDALKGGATDYVTKQRLDRLPRAVQRAIDEAKHRTARRRAEAALRDLNATLEERVSERTAALERSNIELHHEISEREKTEGMLRQAQRLEAVGQLTSGVAHDFNNLLTVVLGNLRFLERDIEDPAARRRLGLIRSAAERGARLTAQLLAFSRRQVLEPTAIDLNGTIADMHDLVAGTMGVGVALKFDLADDLWMARADPTQIELVILNLALNARDAMPDGGSLTVTTENVVLGGPAGPEAPPAGDYVAVTVTDTGSGMPAEIRARAFEPFFTTKDPGKGSGLGLAQVFGFAKQSDGGVRLDTEPGKGTALTVYLPRETAAVIPAQAPANETVEASAPAGAVVLVADDDSAVREVTAGTLAQLGYRVLEAASGREALSKLEGPGGSVDLMLLDFAMPGMNGVEAAAEARRIHPDLPIIFLTGFADHEVLARFEHEETIQKPFEEAELGRKVAGVLRAAS
jgi:signal transduction histidine kinase